MQISMKNSQITFHLIKSNVLSCIVPRKFPPKFVVTLQVYFLNVITDVLTCSKGAGGSPSLELQPGAAEAAALILLLEPPAPGAWPTEPTNPHAPLKM